MPTDYVMFIHGVSTRETTLEPTYAAPLIDLLKRNLGSDRDVQYVSLFWGDVMEKPQQRLREKLQASRPAWDRVWMKRFRENQIMRFAGDAFAYISRHVGYQVVERLQQQIATALQGATAADRLFLVGHSWGGFILFDLFFAGRWDAPQIPGHQEVQFIRNRLFGLGNDPETGVRLVEIHTIGSPIAFLNLINIAGTQEGGGSSHDITPQLQQMLSNLQRVNQQPLPWWNFMHPGDLIAYPLAQVAPNLAGDPGGKFLTVRDQVVRDDWKSNLFLPFSQSILSAAYSGEAHQSYWRSPTVARTIADGIRTGGVRAKAQP